MTSTFYPTISKGVCHYVFFNVTSCLNGMTDSGVLGVVEFVIEPKKSWLYFAAGLKIYISNSFIVS